jgi:hypothetical protein
VKLPTSIWRQATQLLLAGWLLGCGGGSNDGAPMTTPPPDAMFVTSGTAATADGVRLTADAPSGDTITLHVMIGGPTTSQDIYGFAFDLALGDATIAEYVNNSATIGSALTPGAGQTSSLQVSQSGARVIVGLTTLGGGSGNGLAAGETRMLSLRFRVLRQGSTSISFAGPPPSGGNPAGVPAALDSAGVLIGSVSFDGVFAQITAM